MALMLITTINTVNSTLVTGSRTKVPPMGNQMIAIPWKAITPAASTCPASFVGASSPHLSSTTPSATMIATPDSSARGVRPLSNTALIIGSLLARMPPASSPPTIARPPSSGVGVSWTSRSRTGAITFHFLASSLASGVSRYVTAAAATRHRMYSRTRPSPSFFDLADRRGDVRRVC